MAVLLLTPCCPLFFHPPLRYPDPSRPRGAFLSLLLCRSAREWPFKLTTGSKAWHWRREGGREQRILDWGLHPAELNDAMTDEVLMKRLFMESSLRDFAFLWLKVQQLRLCFPLLASPVCLVFSAVNSFKNHVTSLHWVKFFFFFVLNFRLL